MESLQIIDTGMEEKGGSVIYTKAHTDWITLDARTLTPEIDFISNNNQTKRFNDAKTQLTFVSNRIQSMTSPRFTIQCRFNTEDLTDYQRVLLMGQTLGLKKIKGGMGTLSSISGNELGEDYVIIKSFRNNENLTTATNMISCTLVLEMV